MLRNLHTIIFDKFENLRWSIEDAAPHLSYNSQLDIFIIKTCRWDQSDNTRIQFDIWQSDNFPFIEANNAKMIAGKQTAKIHLQMAFLNVKWVKISKKVAAVSA